MATIGIDLGGTVTKIGLVKNNTIISSIKVESHAEDSMSMRLPQIRDAINTLLEENQSEDLSFSALGIAFPSVVDSRKKKILSRYVKFQDAHKFDLVEWAQKNWSVPLALENDARAALLGEWHYGAGRGFDDIVMVTLGTGVGSAVMIEGKLFRGSQHFGGNLGGHTIINLGGDDCNCGAVGCVESEASGWVLDQKFRTHPMFLDSRLAREEKVTFEAVFRLAAEDDLLSKEIRDHCLNTWAASIFNLIHHFDPQAVIIGGGVMHSGDIILTYIKEYINKYCWQEPDSIEIIAAQQSDFAGLLGMAHLAELESK